MFSARLSEIAERMPSRILRKAGLSFRRPVELCVSVAGFGSVWCGRMVAICGAGECRKFDSVDQCVTMRFVGYRSGVASLAIKLCELVAV